MLWPLKTLKLLKLTNVCMQDWKAIVISGRVQQDATVQYNIWNFCFTVPSNIVILTVSNKEATLTAWNDGKTGWMEALVHKHYIEKQRSVKQERQAVTQILTKFTIHSSAEL
jgi:hypothetical protein